MMRSLQKLQEGEVKTWQDTVLKEDKLLALHISWLSRDDNECLGCLLRTCKAQAEASFKASYEKGKQEILRSLYVRVT